MSNINNKGICVRMSRLKTQIKNITQDKNQSGVLFVLGSPEQYIEKRLYGL